MSSRRRHSAGANASSAPACSATSSSLRRCGGHSATDQRKSCGTAAMWAEEETGSSSVAPWISPSATTWSVSGGIDGGGVRAAPPAVAHEQPHDRDRDRGDHRVVDVVQVLLPVLPAGAGLLADERDREHPGDAPEDREHREA